MHTRWLSRIYSEVLKNLWTASFRVSSLSLYSGVEVHVPQVRTLWNYRESWRALHTSNQHHQWKGNKFFFGIGWPVIHMYNVHCTLRWPQKNIRFLILFIPQSSDCKKPFRGFSEILLHNISYEFTSFSIFWPNKKNREKNVISVSGIPYWLRSRKKSAHAHNVFFLLLFFGIAGA